MTRQELQFSIMFFAASEETLGQDKYRLVIESTKFADRNGFSSVWIPERHFATLGGLYPNPSVLHAALAMVTDHIQLRAGSVVLPIHHPIRVAEEWSLVDNLSNGRVGLSFASGWSPDDFAFFPERYEQRWDELFRAIPVVKKLWQGEPLAVTNGLGKEVEVRIYPRPVQPDLPTWVTAARSPATFVKAGEAGANVLTHFLDQDLESLGKKISLYREARARNGHDPEAGLVTVMLHTFVGEDAEEVREQGRKPYCDFLKSNASLLKALAESRDRQTDLESLSPAEKDDFVNFLYDRFASTRALIGTPETCLDLVVKLRSMGVDEIACLLDFGPPFDLVLQNLKHLNRLREVCASEDFSRSVARLPAESLPPAVAEATEATSTRFALQEIQGRCVDLIDGQVFYNRLLKSGLEIAPGLRGVRRVWRRDGESLGEVELKDGESPEAGQTPAALIDCCLQASLAALPPADASGGPGSLYVPWESAKVESLARLTGRLFSHAVLTPGFDDSGEEVEGKLRILSEAGELLALIPSFRLRKAAVAPAATDSVEQWLYEMHWEEAAPAPGTPAEGGAAWLILADNEGIGRGLSRLLEERGDRTLVIGRESLAARMSTGDAEPEEYFRELERSVLGALEGFADGRRAVVFMWGIDTVPPEEMTAASLEADQVIGSGSALSLIRLMAGLPEDRLPKLWIVTRGGQPAGGETKPLQIGQSPLWGLGRTCALEHPELWGGLIDLDPEAEDKENASSLLGVISSESREDQIAVRRGKLFAPRLMKGASLSPSPLALRPDASYLITGGHKGIGLEVARWLVQKGARHLYLLGRSPMQVGDRALEFPGAKVEYVSADVSNEADITSLVKRLSEQGPPLRGVIHAASVWRDEHGKTLIRPLSNLDLSSLREVLRPKLMGGWLLHKALENTPLDFFVCFSSAASLTGSAGQGNYAAASLFLDALAHYRVQSGRRALSINWGPVSGAGFGATPEGLRVHEYWEGNGLKRISVAQLLGALESLLPHSLPQLGVMNIDWEALGRFFPALGKAPWASYLVRPEKRDERAGFLEDLLETPPVERQELLINHLRGQVAEVMGLKSPPDPRRKLFEMGMDSLMALELKNRLQKNLGTDIRVTAVFNYPTIEALSGYLLTEVIPRFVPEAVTATPAERTDGDSALSRIKALSDEEVDRLLEAKSREINPLQ